MNLKKFGLLLVVAVLIIPGLKAVRAYPYPIKITQSDGTTLTIQLHGNEFFHFATTVDGYPLVQQNNIYHYAVVNADGTFSATALKASDISKRTVAENNLLQTLQRNPALKAASTGSSAFKIRSGASSTLVHGSYPLTGTHKSLVILVNFSDKFFVTPNPQAAFTNLLNQQGYSTNGGTGSARDYFVSNSYGIFTPQFDVVGPYTLPHNMAYYGTNDASGNDQNPRQMVIDACTLAYNAGVDFSQYDTNNDGFVDNVFIYYAGYNEAEGGPSYTIWPHRWTLANDSTVFNNKIVFDYACTSELKGNSGSNMCGVGTFCHEFGHVLGLIDLYNTNGDYSYNTLSYWDVMDAGPYLNGGRTPPNYSSYERFFLNWIVPTEIKTRGNYTLDSLNTSKQAYLITQNGNSNLNGQNPLPVEFFMLEDRQQVGWDAYLPGHGMLVTHIYYNATDWANNTANNNKTAMGVDIVEADGIASDATLAGDPFPGTSNVTSYSPVLRSGTNINKPLTKISETKGIIYFAFMGGGNFPTISTMGTLSPFQTVQGTPSASQSFTVSGKYLAGNISLSFTNNLHFEMKRATDPATAWSKTITLAPVDSVVSPIVIQVRYNPLFPSFSSTQQEVLTLTTTGGDAVTINLSGTSTRPVYVIPPVATEASDTTIASFVAHWNPVFDSVPKLAAGYYLTVYHIADGSSSITQHFDNGLTAPIGWTIAATGATSSSVYSGDSVPAIQFNNTGEYILTETYLQPVTSLSFYVRYMPRTGNTYNDTIRVDGLSNGTWQNIGNVIITSSLKGTQSYTLNAANNYTRFRFTYIKTGGSAIIDDVTAGFSVDLTYAEKDKWLTNTSDTLNNLLSGNEYYYFVKASDKSLNNDGTIRYENITEPSNIISVVTLSDRSKSRSLIAIPAGTGSPERGTVTVFLSSTDVIVRVFNILGQLVREIDQPASNKLVITGLPINQTYIISAGNRVAKVIL